MEVLDVITAVVETVVTLVMVVIMGWWRWK